MRRLATALSLTAVAVVSAVPGAGAASGPRWRQLRSVAITLQNGSLPPPGGRPRTTHFTRPAAVSKVTRALNADHIAARGAGVGITCAGGTDVTITIVPEHGTTERLSGYQCGGKTLGGIAGNLTGFLRAVLGASD